MRYYQDFQDVEGITPSRLKRLSADRQWPYIRNWFHRMFEDPSNETPIVDGEFLYIWGGPYDALEELQNEFPDIPFERLETFSRRLEANGVLDWAPGRDHPDHLAAAEEYAASMDEAAEQQTPTLDELFSQLNAGPPPRLNHPEELAERTILAEQLQRLDDKLEELLQLAGKTPGLGHNQPPANYVMEDAVSLSELIEAKHTATDVKSELSKETPDPTRVVNRISYLRKLVSGLSISVPSGIAGGMATVVGKNYLMHNPSLAATLEDVFSQAIKWIQTLLAAPF